jgi:AcrR family transcriptional regulator
MTKADQTRQRILDSAKGEFLENGFMGASLRTIARNAGVTTGALYGCFADKDELFEAVVGPHVEYFRQNFFSAQMSFRALDHAAQRDSMRSHSAAALFSLVDYMYDHLPEFRIALGHAAGSRRQDWLDSVIAIEEESTRLFVAALREDGFPVREMGDEMVHILCSGYFHDIMELVLHIDDRAIAMRNIVLIRDYSVAGWELLLGLN